MVLEIARATQPSVYCSSSECRRSGGEHARVGRVERGREIVEHRSLVGEQRRLAGDDRHDVALAIASSSGNSSCRTRLRRIEGSTVAGIVDDLQTERDAHEHESPIAATRAAVGSSGSSPEDRRDPRRAGG